eukprot:CAMPEP_0201542484 /NCGR_PEP_ID=MMETSP0161_2-20130828/72052_1 /ASSEMBLY_ACC=CAM_ASM_000251 /TAXON_ID=180227 /ORGANISM="Neoparamoeba aestuarina, Strain SoJaBio B1-5/56/2" /LENGTH=149 /DNA_ID=CAMNT_0047950145 /DNA_START=105 /DNA_END=554 /DNA_ORIENTATION=-
MMKKESSSRFNRAYVLVGCLIAFIVVLFVMRMSYSADVNEEEKEERTVRGETVERGVDNFDKIGQFDLGDQRNVDEEEEENKPRKYPAHWGDPPRLQTRDFRELPGGYGFGSGTLAKWIKQHMEQDERDGVPGAIKVPKDLEEEPEYLP